LIVKLGSHSRNPVIAALCDRISGIAGVSKRDTPQRCFLKLGDETLATLGLEQGRPVVEFRTRDADYAAAHGSSFVVPHPQGMMAKQGWLQARPSAGEDSDKLFSWIAALAGELANK
jgi:hypothetical protein